MLDTIEYNLGESTEFLALPVAAAVSVGVLANVYISENSTAIQVSVAHYNELSLLR